MEVYRIYSWYQPSLLNALLHAPGIHLHTNPVNLYKTKIGIFIGAVVILLVIGVLFFCIAKPSTSDEIKTSYLRGTFSIDYSDLNAVVGDADYVFVGTVASEEGTVYKDAVTVETDDGKTREVSGPYTNYTVNVTKKYQRQFSY